MFTLRGLVGYLQAILIAAAFSENWPLMIVCPSALRKMWENNLREWLPDSLMSGLSIFNIASSEACIPSYSFALSCCAFHRNSRQE